MSVELGIIEGFFGAPWPWEVRERTISLLAPHGYRFYLYAPKADAYLRRKWQEPHPPETAERLAQLSKKCRALGVRFGVGLSPFEMYEKFDAAARDALARKLAFLDELGIDDLAILYDDMRGELPDLASRQVETVHWVKERTRAKRLIMCPSYYSDSPVLDKVFGRRPERYLEQLGAQLHPSIHVFWTGEEVCSFEISPGHLKRVAEQLQRKPFLWDNYPVNDGARMSRYLHLRGFTGRPASLAGHIAAHGINPSLQPTLFSIPALTLAESYRVGEDYQYGDAFRRAAVEVLGPELGGKVPEDLLTFQAVGLERISAAQKKELVEKYSAFPHPGAAEIVAWLQGKYGITDEVVKTQ